MGDAEGLNLEEPDESNLAESRDLYLEAPEPEVAVTPAEEGPAECDNGFEGEYADGLVSRGLEFEGPAPKGLVFEGPAPKDGALERPDPEDATCEVATLSAAALDGSALEGPSVDGSASKTDAL